jgi:biopolymer transport protein ExbD
MKRRHLDWEAGEESPEFQVSAMVDILMTLLIFFVVTATYEGVRQPADLRLPLATRELPEIPEVADVVLLLEKNAASVQIDGQPVVKVRDLVPQLRERMRVSRELRGENSEFRLIIRADRDTPYRRIEEIMHAAGEAGVVDVLFSMEKAGSGEGL